MITWSLCLPLCDHTSPKPLEDPLGEFWDEYLSCCQLHTNRLPRDGRPGALPNSLLLLLYAESILGNIPTLFIIKEEHSLHQPMYDFLSLQSVNDLGVSFSTLPTYWQPCAFHAPETAFDACLTQMFFTHFISWTESGILLAMSFDQYVATCNPLQCLLRVRWLTWAYTPSPEASAWSSHCLFF